MFVTISLAYFLWYTLLAMFSCSAVIQSIISYLTSKKTLHVILILLFISHLFDVEKENITCNFILYDVKLLIYHLFDVKKENITYQNVEKQNMLVIFDVKKETIAIRGFQCLYHTVNVSFWKSNEKHSAGNRVWGVT